MLPLHGRIEARSRPIRFTREMPGRRQAAIWHDVGPSIAGHNQLLGYNRYCWWADCYHIWLKLNFSRYKQLVRVIKRGAHGYFLWLWACDGPWSAKYDHYRLLQTPTWNSHCVGFVLLPVHDQWGRAPRHFMRDIRLCQDWLRDNWDGTMVESEIICELGNR